MSVTMKKLFSDSKKDYSLELIAGRDGMEKSVRWVHMVEDSEVPDFLHGDELVFTTGIGHSGTEWLIDFVRQLKNHRAVGLVVNIGPYITSVPAQAIVFCEQNDFPLFTMPWKSRIIDVTYDFCHRIVASEKNETTIASAFRYLIFNPENKDAYSSVLERAGFHNEGIYSVMSVFMKINDKSAAAEDWKKYRFSYIDLLKSPDYPSCVFIQNNQLTVINQHSGAEELLEQAEKMKASFGKEKEKIEIFAGVSETGIGLGSVPDCYEQSLCAMNTARIKGRSSVNYSETGVYRVISGVEDTAVLSGFAADVLGPLEEYDRKNSSDLCTVLKCYLQSVGSVQDTAQKLGVHRNTVNHKIRLVKETLGISLDNENIVNLMLAFSIRDYISL